MDPLTSAGVDHVLQSDLLDHGQIVVTNSSGTSAPWIGEYVLGVMLQRSRSLNVALRAQMRGEWFHQQVRVRCHSLRGKTIGIVGYGSIGRAAARWCNRSEWKYGAQPRGLGDRETGGP